VVPRRGARKCSGLGVDVGVRVKEPNGLPNGLALIARQLLVARVSDDPPRGLPTAAVEMSLLVFR
jgi:hypothetical protein